LLLSSAESVSVARRRCAPSYRYESDTLELLTERLTRSNMTAGRSTLRLECYNEIEVQAGFAREDRIMATIYWGSGVSGTFSTASDWAGGVVPGAGDTAVINAASTSQYTVSVTSATTVGGLILDQSEAVLAIDSSFTAASISLEAGDLQLNQGTLSGSVV
jgi:hypothetical protein